MNSVWHWERKKNKQRGLWFLHQIFLFTTNNVNENAFSIVFKTAAAPPSIKVDIQSAFLENSDTISKPKVIKD